MNKKLLVAVAVIAASSSAFAAVNKQGLYIGGQAGISRADYGSDLKDATEAVTNHKIEQGGFGWAALAGFNFNKMFALEGGYIRYADNTYKQPDYNYEVKEKLSAWTLMAKASLPLSDSNFDVYAKAGAAYLQGKEEKTGYEDMSGHKVRPIAAIGGGYTFDNGLGIDLSVSHVFGSSQNDGIRKYPNADMVAVGLTYNFQQWA
jgi:opacity protein-like surface antigen